MAAATPTRGRNGGGGSLYRLEVASRALAAIVGGFLLASAVALLVTAVLIATGAQSRGLAAFSGTEVSWLFWTGGAMWAFHARRHAMAWLGLLVPAAMIGGLAFLIGFGA